MAPAPSGHLSSPADRRPTTPWVQKRTVLPSRKGDYPVHAQRSRKVLTGRWIHVGRGGVIPTRGWIRFLTISVAAGLAMVIWGIIEWDPTLVLVGIAGFLLTFWRRSQFVEALRAV